jgi:hypothetical protein
VCAARLSCFVSLLVWVAVWIELCSRVDRCFVEVILLKWSPWGVQYIPWAPCFPLQRESFGFFFVIVHCPVVFCFGGGLVGLCRSCSLLHEGLRFFRFRCAVGRGYYVHILRCGDRPGDSRFMRHHCGHLCTCLIAGVKFGLSDGSSLLCGSGRMLRYREPERMASGVFVILDRCASPSSPTPHFVHHL